MKYTSFDLDLRAFGRTIVDSLEEVPCENLADIVNACLSVKQEQKPLRLGGMAVFSTEHGLSFTPDISSISASGLRRFAGSSDSTLKANLAKKAVFLFFSKNKKPADRRSPLTGKGGVSVKNLTLSAAALLDLNLPLKAIIGLKKRVLKAMIGQPAPVPKEIKIRAFAAFLNGKLQLFLPSEKVGLVVQHSLFSLDYQSLLKLDAALSECMRVATPRGDK